MGGPPRPPAGWGPSPLGDYLLLAPLGEGGMGEVFLAKTHGLGDIEKLCVVKTLREQYAGDAEYVGRFVDEARVVVQLSHRNICHVFDVGRVGGRTYLAMEHVQGRTLKSLLDRVTERGEVLPPEVAVYLVREVLDALDYAHRRLDPATGQPLHLVHRDVSPQNVMVNYEGEVKLIDFGLAASRLKREQTRPDVVMGKMAYMSPEQARGETVDPRTDVFAAAVTLVELLSGERYYAGKSPDEVFALVGSGVLEGRTYRPPGFALLDGDLRKILERALAPHPSHRTPDAASFLEDLDGWLLDRRLRVNGRVVRELMGRLFPDEERHEAERVARFLAQRESPLPGAGDRTERIAVSPSLLGELGDLGALSDTGPVFSDEVVGRTDETATAPSAPAASEPTAIVDRSPPPDPRAPRRAGLVVGLAGFLVVVGTLVTGALLLSTRDGGGSTMTAGPPARPPPPPAASKPLSDDGDNPPAPEPDADPAAPPSSPPAGAAAVPPSPAASTSGTPSTRRGRGRAPPPAAPRPGPTPPGHAPVAEPSAPTTAEATPPATSTAAQIEALRTCAEPCAATLVRDWAIKRWEEPLSRRSFDRDVDRCYRRCAR